MTWSKHRESVKLAENNPLVAFFHMLKSMHVWDNFTQGSLQVSTRAVSVGSPSLANDLGSKFASEIGDHGAITLGIPSQ